jgi:hypothetical protein
MAGKKVSEVSEVPEVVEAPKKGLASDDPKWPPIGVRFASLTECSGVIPWANGLGLKAETRPEAVLAIMRHEYGEKAFKAWQESQ